MNTPGSISVLLKAYRGLITLPFSASPACTQRDSARPPMGDRATLLVRR